GAEEARRLFEEAPADASGPGARAASVNDAFITRVERRLAGSVGAATARAMVSRVVTGETISLDELIRIADEAQQIRDYSHRIEEKSRQLETAARQLEEANERLTRLDRQKDDFLSQVS